VNRVGFVVVAVDCFDWALRVFDMQGSVGFSHSTQLRHWTLTPAALADARHRADEIALRDLTDYYAGSFPSVRVHASSRAS
jgi:hypothetical protein